MKNVFNNTRKGILIIAMFVTLLSFAKEVTFLAENDDVKKTMLVLRDVKAGNLLSIKDEKGKVVYKELIVKEGTYKKGFDLTSLYDGNYVFEIHKDLELKIIPFIVKSHIVTFKKEEEKIVFKPFARVKGNLVYITKLSLDKDPLEIEVFFNPSNSAAIERVFSEKIKGVENINRIYKLSGLDRGTYKIVFKSEGQVFTKEIN